MHNKIEEMALEYMKNNKFSYDIFKAYCDAKKELLNINNLIPFLDDMVNKINDGTNKMKYSDNGWVFIENISKDLKSLNNSFNELKNRGRKYE